MKAGTQLGATVVRPLEGPWQALLEGVARSAKLPTAPAEVAALVQALSSTYNDGKDFAQQQTLLAPRLLFSLPRDLQKGAAAVRELVATGLLRLGDAPLRILDLGAGLGAATIGVLRALETRGAAGASGEIDATWVDHDAPALQLGSRVVQQARAAGLLRSTITIHEHAQKLDGKLPAGPYDLVIACQVMCELDPKLTDDARAAKLAARVSAWLPLVADGGSLVIIEPALRERTRVLHQVRDLLLAQRAATLFAPCLHAAPCPALADPGDWCHEDLEIDLPAWLIPIAKQAGLRYQGLTFSYLVLRKDGQSLQTLRPDATLRVVSDARPQKGKCERWLCGRFADGETRQKVVLLDRHAGAQNEALGDSGRGSLLAIAPAPRADTPRLALETMVKVVDE